MNKVKIMLSALVVVAAIGGALAFKAKNPTFCYYKLNAAGDKCPIVRTISSFETTDVVAQTASVIDKTPGIACPATQATVDCTLKVLTTTIDNN